MVCTEGALRYLYQNPNSFSMYLKDDANAMFGIMSDGVYGGTCTSKKATSVQYDDGMGCQCRLQTLLEPRSGEHLSMAAMQKTNYNTTPANALPRDVLWCRALNRAHSRSQALVATTNWNHSGGPLSYAVEHHKGL